MRRRYLTSKCLRRYYSALTWHCPSVMHKTRDQRERVKIKLRAQLSGKITVILNEIQVNKAQIYESTSIKGSASAEKKELEIEQQNEEVDVEEEETIDVRDAEAAHIISHESLLQQPQQQQYEPPTTDNRYELDLTGSIDTKFTTVTTTTTNVNLNLKTNFETTPHNNNNTNNRPLEELSVNVEAPNSDVETQQTVEVEALSDLGVEPAKIPTKVFVFNVPRAFTSCSFENPISFDLCKPEDMVQIIAPQVRNLLYKRADDETLQATKILEQINDANGMLINEEPSTRRRGRKRGNSNNSLTAQPVVKKKGGDKRKLEVQQESEQKSLLEFYESAGWIFDEQGATPQPCNDENTSLDSTVVRVSRNISTISWKA